MKVFVSTLIYQVFGSPSIHGSSILFFILSNLSSRAVLSSEFSVWRSVKNYFVLLQLNIMCSGNTNK